MQTQELSIDGYVCTCLVVLAELNTLNNIPIMKFFKTYAPHRVFQLLVLNHVHILILLYLILHPVAQMVLTSLLSSICLHNFHLYFVRII